MQLQIIKSLFEWNFLSLGVQEKVYHTSDICILPLTACESSKHLFAFLLRFLDRNHTEQGSKCSKRLYGTPSNRHVLDASFTDSLKEAAKISAKLGWELDLFENSETFGLFVIGDFVIQDLGEAGVFKLFTKALTLLHTTGSKSFHGSSNMDSL